MCQLDRYIVMAQKAQIIREWVSKRAGGRTDRRTNKHTDGRTDRIGSDRIGSDRSDRIGWTDKSDGRIGWTCTDFDGLTDGRTDGSDRFYLTDGRTYGLTTDGRIGRIGLTDGRTDGRSEVVDGLTDRTDGLTD